MSDLLQLLRLALGELAHGRFPHNDILKPLISKVGAAEGRQSSPSPRFRPGTPRSSLPVQVLGYGILAGSTMVKLPQVAAVVRARSAAGLSPLSFELETLGLVIAVTYGFLMGLPFSAFGETVVSGGLV
jgi:hypothetical protein